VINTAYIALLFPTNKSCIENFELMQRQWQVSMDRLQQLVDDSLDSEVFITTYERLILKETYRMQMHVQDKNNACIIANALNIAKRSNRIIQIANQESDNSEDTEYVNRIMNANDSLKLSLPQMIHSAKLLAIEPSNKDVYLIWTHSNENVKQTNNKINHENRFIITK
jgi:hypothetical protein